ncbi:MAG: RNA polymerase sigma factor [Clostridia bacterium]
MVEDLIIKARQGNQESLIQLIMAQKQDYYKLAFVYMKNEEDALDVMEDMIVAIYENIHLLKNNEAFYSWSKTILVNRCKALLKKKKKVIYTDYIQEKVYEEKFNEKEEQVILEEHLSRLNAKHQEVLKLRYFLDLNYQSIAQLLKVPIGTVKSRINIGLRKLRESIGGETL